MLILYESLYSWAAAMTNFSNVFEITDNLSVYKMHIITLV